MQLSRALFVLPTLFTLTSVYLAVVSLVAAAQGDFRASAMAICFAFLFDSIDGRVARLTRTQSKFGIQIDSLADVISFGIAPALLVYQSLLRETYTATWFDPGLLAAFAYVAAGAVRLARYNVVAERKRGPVVYFTGLPIPAAAGCLAGVVLALTGEGRSMSAGMTVVMLLLLAGLMVSPFRFRKRISVREPDTAVLLALLAVVMAVTAAVRPAFTVFSFFAYYTAVGLIESGLVGPLLVLGRRKMGKTEAQGDEPGDSSQS